MDYMQKILKSEKRERLKGQVALESLIVVGFILLLMIPLLYTLYSRILSVQEELAVLEATRAADTIVTAVSTVGMGGPNGSATIDISLPPNVKNISIGATSVGKNPREIIFTLDTTLGNIDVVRLTPYNVSGSIPIRQGKQTIKIVYYEDGRLIVG